MGSLVCTHCRSELVIDIGLQPDFQTRVYQCQECGLIQSEPVLSGTTDAYYKKYYRELRKEKITSNYLEFMSKRALSQKEFIENTSCKKEFNAILEVGGGCGALISSLNAKYRVVAEADPVYRQFLEETYPDLHVVPDLASLPIDKKYDLIVMSHVLEHLVSPLSVLRSLSDLAFTNCLIFIEVPNENISTVIASLEKGAGGGHLFFFSDESLEEIVNCNSGWVTKDTSTAGLLMSDYLANPNQSLDNFCSDGQDRIWLRKLLDNNSSSVFEEQSSIDYEKTLRQKELNLLITAEQLQSEKLKCASQIRNLKNKVDEERKKGSQSVSMLSDLADASRTSFDELFNGLSKFIEDKQEEVFDRSMITISGRLQVAEKLLSEKIIGQQRISYNEIQSSKDYLQSYLTEINKTLSEIKMSQDEYKRFFKEVSGTINPNRLYLSEKEVLADLHNIRAENKALKVQIGKLKKRLVVRLFSWFQKSSL